MQILNVYFTKLHVILFIVLYEIAQMLIKREIQEKVASSTPPKASVILGPRQVGKSTLFKQIVNSDARWIDGEKPSHVNKLQRAYESGDLETILKSAPTLVIDEAQKIPNIGSILKTLVDANEGTKIFVTGSSSLQLAGGVKESALGRLVEGNLWPISLAELSATKGKWDVDDSLATRVVFGMYPEAISVNNPSDYLTNLASELLFKDIFSLAGIRNSQSFTHLAYTLATNIGQEVNYDSLSREVSLSKASVMKYIDLMEQCFIIKVCHSYSSNIENELKKGKKIYFVDTGIRNALLDDFSPLSSRHDAGALWENFFFMERLKFNSYQQNHRHLYFWRTRLRGRETSTEVDFVEVKNRKPVRAFECKLSEKAHSRGESIFLQGYPETKFDLVNPSNALSILWND